MSRGEVTGNTNNRMRAKPSKSVYRWGLLIALLLLWSILSVGCAKQSISSHNSLEEFTAYFDERIPRWMDRYQVPGVGIALIVDGKLAWTGAYGYADVDNQRTMTVDAVCRAESISKSVTAWGVMNLVEQGLIDLDAPIQRYLKDWQLPDSEYDDRSVTVRMLLSGSAGMPLGPIGESVEYEPNSEMPSLRDYLDDEAILVQEPGSSFMYSNVGFNLLELIIEEVTGQAFSEYMKDEVLTPLGMENAYFSWEDAFVGAIPNGYEFEGTEVAPYVYPVLASGGLIASLPDIGRFAAAGMPDFSNSGEAVLEPESIRLLYLPQVEIPGLFGLVADAYGFGHFIEILPGGQKSVWHGGQGHGWMTHFQIIPKKGDGIVILTNSERSWPLFAEVLTDWAAWRGFGSVKFGRIIHATHTVQILVGVVGAVAVWLLYRLISGILTGDRKFAPLGRESRTTRLLSGISGLAILLAIGWCAAQPFLFLTAIFPSVYPWAAGVLIALAIGLLLFALYPMITRNSIERNHSENRRI